MLLQAKVRETFPAVSYCRKKALAYLSYCDRDLIPVAASCKPSRYFKVLGYGQGLVSHAVSQNLACRPTVSIV